MTKKPTDDELLSYLFGDLDSPRQAEVDQWLKQNETNRAHLKTLIFFRNEIKSSPLVPQKRTWQQRLQVYFLRASFLAMAFTIGMVTQAYWPVLSSNDDSQSNSPLSEPLSLESRPNEKYL